MAVPVAVDEEPVAVAALLVTEEAPVAVELAEVLTADAAAVKSPADE